MSTRTFPVEWLERHHIAVEGMSKLVVHREFGEHQEYGSTWTVVFTHEGRYWQATYQNPNTSEVHVDTWFDDQEIIAIEVRPQPRFVTEWVPVTRRPEGRCTEPIIGGGQVIGTCSLAAPFLVALTVGNRIESLERCVAHTHLLVTSPETFPKVEEVRRRWH